MSAHRVLIGRLPQDDTFLGGKWATTCSYNHFIRFASTWAGAWSWATEHCPSLLPTPAQPDEHAGADDGEQ